VRITSRSASALGEERRGSVLVDNCVDALQVPVPAHDRDPAPPAGDGNRSRGDERADRIQLDDVERPGGGDDAPEAAPRVLDELPATVAAEGSRLLLAVEGADRLGGLGERRVVGIDVDVREEARNGSCRRRGELRLDQRPDLGLRLSDRQVERQWRYLVGRPLLA
jgi:hypothetical protein